MILLSSNYFNISILYTIVLFFFSLDLDQNLEKATDFNFILSESSLDVVEYQDSTGFQIGKDAPPFEAELFQTNQIVNNNFFKGSYVLIDIWSTSCGVCIRHRPDLEKTWEKFKDKNFKIWSVAMHDTPEKLQTFRNERYKMPWLHTVYPDARESIFWKDLHVRGIPRYILISPDGLVLENTKSFSNLSIDEIMANSSTP